MGKSIMVSIVVNSIKNIIPISLLIILLIISFMNYSYLKDLDLDKGDPIDELQSRLDSHNELKNKGFPRITYLSDELIDAYKINNPSFFNEAKKGWTDEQFYYKLRKKGFGPFKKEIASLSKKTRDLIASEVEAKFDFLFKQLNVAKTKELVNKYCKIT